MDIEKTMEFILQSQARFEQNQARFEQNQVRFQQNHERFEQDHARAMRRMDRTDKQIEGIKKLIMTGMKLIVRLEKRDDEIQVKIDALVDSQMRAEERMKTHEKWLRKHDARFERFMAMMRGRNGNGSKGRR
jgi:chromosome segregation ATPase